MQTSFWHFPSSSAPRWHRCQRSALQLAPSCFGVKASHRWLCFLVMGCGFTITQTSLVAAERRGLDLELSFERRMDAGRSRQVLVDPAAPPDTAVVPRVHLLGGKGTPWCDRGPSLAADPWRNSVMVTTRDLDQRRKIHVSA